MPGRIPFAGFVARRAVVLGLTGGAALLVWPNPAHPAQGGTSGGNASSDQREATAALITEDLLQDAASPTLGNLAGDVTIVEFFDYRCPYCKVMAPRLTALIGKDSGLRVVMKEYPILSRESVFAAKVALVAAHHRTYDAFHAAMYAAAGPIDNQKTLQVAQSVGLPPEAIRSEMNSEDVLAELRRNLALGALIGVTGTPAFVVGRNVVPGAVSIEALAKLIDAARQKRG